MSTRADKIALVCDKDDKRIIPIEILNFNGYEKENFEMIMRLIDDGFKVFDIGGNIGWYSINIAKMKKVDVFTFEPIPKTFNYLMTNIKLNKVNNIHPFNFGFSNTEQDVSFYYYPAGSGNASLANLSEKQDVHLVTCQVKTLDKFVSDNNLPIDFIKCDVEGAELFVFQGGRQTITEYKPVIFVELLRKWAVKFDYHPNEVIKLLGGIGYRCFTITGETLTEFSLMDEATKDTNFFFLHEKKHKAKIDSFVKA